MNRFITGVNILLVILVAIGSFVLSYSALSDLASKNGFSDWRAYVLPLVIDVGMLAFGLAVVHAHLHGTNPIRRRGLNLAYIIATVTFNILHAPANPLAQALAALPPVTLFFAFEVLMSQVETGLKSKTQTVDNAQFAELRDTVETLENQSRIARADANEFLHKIGTLKEDATEAQKFISQLQEQATTLQTQAQTLADWNLLNATAKAVWIAQHTNGDRPPASHLAKALGCATSTVSRAYEAVDKGKHNGQYRD